MTHDILQSDIDLARGMLQSGCDDAQIVQALQLRKVSSDRALGLVRDLRAGIDVLPDASFLPSPSKPAPIQPSTASGTVRPAQRQKTSSSHKKRSHKSSWFPLLAAGSIIALIVVIFVVNHRRHPEKTAALTSGLNENVTNSSPLAVSIDENGLSIAGVKVSEHPLTTIVRLVGPPSRTNRVDASQYVYAFDNHGILVYHGGEPSKDSVVIDFEATGGTNGAASRFVGKFEVEKKPISATSDAATLATLKDHGLEGGETKSGIYRLQYPGLVVIFAFLTNSNRLSLVEIDFN